MSNDAVARQGSWQAFDQVLCLLNSLDVPADMTADQMRRKIYGLVHGLRPGGSQSLSEWRDISTAPKVESEVLLWAPYEERPVIGTYADGAWRESETYSAWVDGSEPTHWMPLPDAPGEVNP